MALIGTGAMVLATHADTLCKTFADVVAAGKKAQGVRQGIDVRTGTPQAAQAFIEGQIDVWAKVVKDNGSKAD